MIFDLLISQKRFQLRGIPVTKAEDVEISEEAEWIYKQAFSINTISIQEGEYAGSGHQPIAGRKKSKCGWKDKRSFEIHAK
ncbi:transcription elongation factor SPT6 [Caerostris extrusa]|uniref:Transcription elongation factor SPT6 n=1 Tax=Caerostris extrusa TaxID=172846 RepID=A0AAV4WJM9_CAEEX|nr:transcription elongation factor SPT6 [Caerostris extrusa]